MAAGLSFIMLSVGAGAVALVTLKAPSGKKVETAVKAISTLGAMFVVFFMFTHIKQFAGIDPVVRLVIFFVVFQGIQNNLRDIESFFR